MNDPTQNLIRLTKKLVSFQTTADNPKEVSRCFDFIVKYLGKGFFVNRFLMKDKESIIVSNQSGRNFDVILNGHLDVVPASSSDFKPKIKNGRIYGRGASDMKGVAAAMIICFKNLSLTSKAKVALMLTSDEERGGDNGTGFLLKKGYRGRVAIVPDGGNNFNLVEEEKGVLSLKMTTFGRSAHSAKPWEGENAIVKLISDCRAIIKAFSNPKNNKDWKTSINLSRIKGGLASNQVPDKAEAHLDIRFIFKDSSKRILEKVKRNCQYSKIEVRHLGDGFKVNSQNIYIKKFIEIAGVIINRRVKLVKHPASSDARFFNVYQIPAIIFKPPCGNNHGPNEWISIVGLEKFIRILKIFIEEVNSML